MSGHTAVGISWPTDTGFQPSDKPILTADSLDTIVFFRHDCAKSAK